MGYTTKECSRFLGLAIGFLKSDGRRVCLNTPSGYETIKAAYNAAEALFVSLDRNRSRVVKSIEVPALRCEFTEKDYQNFCEVCRSWIKKYPQSEAFYRRAMVRKKELIGHSYFLVQ